MAIDGDDSPGLYFGTSTGQVFASADEGDSWDEIASYLPAISSVEVAVVASDGRGASPDDAAAALPGAAAEARRRGGNGRDAIDDARRAWPGLRDRLCEQGPALRPHIHVYVDRERAGLDTGLDARSRVDVIAAISGG